VRSVRVYINTVDFGIVMAFTDHWVMPNGGGDVSNTFDIDE